MDQEALEAQIAEDAAAFERLQRASMPGASDAEIVTLVCRLNVALTFAVVDNANIIEGLEDEVKRLRAEVLRQVNDVIRVNLRAKSMASMIDLQREEIKTLDARLSVATLPQGL